MNEEQHSIDQTLAASTEAQIEAICTRFESAWKSGVQPALEDYLAAGSKTDEKSLLARLLAIELEHRRQRDPEVGAEHYLQRFPKHSELIQRLVTQSQTQAVTAPAKAQLAPALTETHRTGDELGSTQAEQPRGDRESSDIPHIPGYDAVGIIGRGGMGLVIKAHDQVLRRTVAIKLPLRARTSNAESRERFLREARSVASLRHPHICPIYDVGEVDDRPYLVIAFIAGQSMDRWARTNEASPHRVAEVIASLARAVGYAHSQGVVHRDIKPANVMIDSESGEPILMDFGLAKNLADEDVQLTQSGQVMGTPVYMAPEQAAGRTAEIGKPADVYALGVVLYELLCGQRPFEGSFGEVLKQVQTAEPKPPRQIKSGLHHDLETICLKAMAKEQERRYESADDLAEDLERFCKGEAILARREPLMSKVIRKTKNNPAMVAAMLGILAAVVVAAMFGSRFVEIQRTTAIGRGIDQQLNQVSLDEAFLLEAETSIGELAKFAPQQAADARRRLYQAYDSAIRAKLRQASLTAADFDRVEMAIASLEQRAPTMAEALGPALFQRKRTWQSIFQLSAPFDQLGDLFDENSVSIENDRLVRLHDNSRQRVEPLQLTRQPSFGSVELRATFADDWLSASQVGVVLNGRAESRYAFRLRTDQWAYGSQGEPKSFAVAQEGPEYVTMSIHRGETLLVERQVLMPSLGSGELRLEAKREGNTLTFQVSDLEPLTFRDIFSVSSRDPGRFGVVWPQEVSLVSIEGFRQSLPPAASPLEQGDELFLLGHFNKARDFFRQQSIASSDTAAGQEATYKEALCLLAVDRNQDAARQFESLAGKESQAEADWPLLAACQLWLIRLQQNNTADAEAIFQSLSARYRFEELAALVPDGLRESILRQYASVGVGLNLLTFNPERVRDLERAVEIERFLDVPEITHVHAKRSLIRAYRAAGQIDKAVQFARSQVEGVPVKGLDYGDNLVEEYSWLMRLHGNPQRALAEIDRRLFEPSGEYREFSENLLVERSRIQAALARWDQAEHDIDEFFRLVDTSQRSRFHHSSAASLIRGFLRERKGDLEGALQAWRDGKAGLQLSSVDSPSKHNIGSRMLLLNYLSLASLSGDLTDQEANLLLTVAFQSEAAGSTGAIFQNAITLPPSVLRDMFRSPRGKEVARQMAFQTITFEEFLRLPVLVVGSEYARQRGFGAALSPEDEQLIWEVFDRTFAAYQAGQIGAPQVLQLGLTWKGTTNAFGWGGVQGSLPPQLRAYLAYLFANRFQRLGEPQQARMFLNAAQKDAAAESLLHQRVSQLLEQNEAP